MIVTIQEIKRFSFRNVQFYTVSKEGKLLSEYADFIERMEKKCRTQLGELVHLIDEIGQKYRAEEKYFRPERNAHALPPKFIHLPSDDAEENSEFGLRLYCCRFSPEIVILYNGDLKTTHYPDKCPNVSKHFKFALEVTKKIDEGINNGDISLSNKDILIDEDFTLEL